MAHMPDQQRVLGHGDRSCESSLAAGVGGIEGKVDQLPDRPDHPKSPVRAGVRERIQTHLELHQYFWDYQWGEKMRRAGGSDGAALCLITKTRASGF